MAFTYDPNTGRSTGTPTTDNEWQQANQSSWTDPNVEAMVDRDRASWEARLRQEAQQRGVTYDPSDLEGVVRHVGYGANAGADPERFIQQQLGVYDRRAADDGQRGPDAAPQSVAQQWNAQPGPQTDPRADALYQALTARSQQGLDVDRTNPAVRAQADAFSAQQDRSQRNYISDTAERMGPFASGALQGERRMAAERAGQASGAFEAQLVGREIAARRDEIAQALSQMQGLLTTDQEMALRRELADLEATLRREGYDLQREGLNLSNDQFLRDLALRESNQNNYWDYAWSGF